MNKSALYMIAWIVVPIGFFGYVDFAYSLSLGGGELPFLGMRILRWQVAFAAALALGAGCTLLASTRAGTNAILWSAFYLVVMSAVLAGVHLLVACSSGACI